MCVFFGRIRRGSPPTSSVSSSPVSSWRTAGPSPTTTSRRSPPFTSCCACAAGSLNPRSASSPRSTTATRQGWKKSGFFLKKPAEWFFLYICPEGRVFRVFSVSRIRVGKNQPSGVFFLSFVFWGFFLYICPEKRVFRVFSVSRIL